MLDILERLIPPKNDPVEYKVILQYEFKVEIYCFNAAVIRKINPFGQLLNIIYNFNFLTLPIRYIYIYIFNNQFKKMR